MIDAQEAAVGAMWGGELNVIQHDRVARTDYIQSLYDEQDEEEQEEEEEEDEVGGGESRHPLPYPRDGCRYLPLCRSNPSLSLSRTGRRNTRGSVVKTLT